MFFTPPRVKAQASDKRFSSFSVSQWQEIQEITLPSAGVVGSAARGASAPTAGGEWLGHIVAAARLQLVCYAL